MSRVLVTGGSGFIGHYVCTALFRAGRDVTILDLVAPSHSLEQAAFVRGDVRDPRAVEQAMHGCDLVIHLAAAHHDFGIADETYFDVNEGGARVLCRAMDAAGVRDACFYSSVAVYGGVPEPRTEDVSPAPSTPYGASKLAGEEVFRRWTAQRDGRRALVIRPAVVFGPHNFANMYALIRQVHSRLFLPIGNGENVKSTAYVENLVDATFYLLARRDRPVFDVYNYVDTPDLTSREICDAIAESLGRTRYRWSIPLAAALALATPFDAAIHLTGRNLPISSARVRKLATMQTRFDAAKVRRAGFAPRVSLRDGLRLMTEWYVREGRHRTVQSHLPPPRVGDALVPAGKAAGA